MVQPGRAVQCQKRIAAATIDVLSSLVSLVQLESFVAVAEERHVGRAARRLHVSQPPLSRRIRSLEEELGVELFERRRDGMHLLPTGRTLLEHARDILKRVELARFSVTSPPRDEAQGHDSGTDETTRSSS